MSSHHYDNESEEGPVSTFQSYAAEGDILAKRSNYKKAIEAYTKALLLRPNEKNVLVSRSRCHIAVGNNKAALDDADAALKDDENFFKAKFQKAEALYAMGDFEMALVYYHRGHSLRPEYQEFRLGIQKAKEAIENSIGEPEDYKKAEKAEVNIIIGTKTIEKDERCEKQLLEELYVDKEYLESMLRDPDFVNNPNEDIISLIKSGLEFLESRTEFWRQQKPMYARKKESICTSRRESERTSRHPSTIRRHSDAPGNSSHAESRRVSEKTGNSKKGKRLQLIASHSEADVEKSPTPYNDEASGKSWLTSKLEEINNEMERSNNEKVVKLAKSLISYLNSKDPNKKLELISEKVQPFTLIKASALTFLYGAVAKIYVDLENLEEGEVWTKRAVAAAGKYKNTESLSSALLCQGRHFVKTKQYENAIKVFEEKLSLTEEKMDDGDIIEKTFILHEIAKCYQMLAKDQSMELALKSVEKAENLITGLLEKESLSPDVKTEANKWAIRVFMFLINNLARKQVSPNEDEKLKLRNWIERVKTLATQENDKATLESIKKIEAN